MYKYFKCLWLFAFKLNQQPTFCLKLFLRKIQFFLIFRGYKKELNIFFLLLTTQSTN